MRGVLPIIPTPFTPDDKIDERSLRRIVRHAIAAGAGALVYPGVASEDIYLTAGERDAALRIVVETVAGRLPVIAGVNREEPGEMVEAAAGAARSGASAAMAMATAAMDNPAAWLARIAEALGDRPIVLQNLGAPRGAGLSADAMLAIARDVAGVRYVKEEGVPSGPTVSRLVEGAGPDLDGVIGGGGARYLFEELERGIVATMPAIEILDLHVAIMRAHAAGNRTRALELYERSVPLLLLQAPYRMRLTKLLLKRRGIIEHDGVREPLPEMDEVTRDLTLELSERVAGDGLAAVA